MKFYKLFGFFLTFSTLISSCSKYDGIDYIPEDSIIVAKINTEQIVKDALFDFASESNIFNELIQQFPEYEDFANTGIDELNQFYFFAQLQTSNKFSLGAIIPLKEKDLFKKFILNRFKINVSEENSFEFINVNEKYVILWNSEMALFYSNEQINFNILTEAIKIAEKKMSTISNKGEVFTHFKDSKDHVLVWVDNFSNNLLNKQLNDLNIPQNDFYSFTSLNFNKGALNIESKSFYKNENSVFKNLLSNDKSVEDLLISSGSSQPLLVASMALNFNGLIDYLNENEALYNTLQANVPFVNIKEFIRMFSGDFLITFNGVEEEVVQFYDEKVVGGVLEVVADEKVVKTPFLTYAIGLNDSKKLIEMLNPFLGMIPYEFTKKSSESIVFETDEEYHVSLQNNILFLGTSAKARKLIRGMNTELDINYKNKILKYPFYLFADIDGIAQTLKDNDNVEIVDLISNTFTVFELIDYSVDKNEIKAALELKFKNDENSLIELIKFFKVFSEKNKNQIL